MKKILFELLAIFFVLPAMASLPVGYTELEYIESTGTQYIDTGVYGDLNTKMEMDFALMATQSTNLGIYGAGTSDQNSSAFAMNTNSGGTYIFPQFDSVSRTQKSNLSFTLGTKYHIVHSKDGWYYNDVLGATWSKPSEFTTSGALWLFGINNVYSKSASRIYYAKIFNGTELVRDFIPAKRNSDGVIGMYDITDVNSNTAFHINAGSGTFIAGPEVIIKIATTKMVDEEFAAAEAKLATTVQTIESVVSRTITQTEQIAALQAEKQTRPNESCPANKKCLLVEDEQGIPHWYEIIE